MSGNSRTRVQVLFSHLPSEELQEAVNSDAQDRDVSVNEAVGQALSAYYGIAWTNSHAPYREYGEIKKLWVPRELREKLREDALLRSGTITGVAFDALSRHYGLSPVDPRRRPRTSKQQAA